MTMAMGGAITTTCHLAVQQSHLLMDTNYPFRTAFLDHPDGSVILYQLGCRERTSHAGVSLILIHAAFISAVTSVPDVRTQRRVGWRPLV